MSFSSFGPRLLLFYYFYSLAFFQRYSFFVPVDFQSLQSSSLQEMLDAAFIKYESNTAMQMGQEVIVQ